MDFLLQTFNSFDDFLDEDEDDGYYKSPSNEDCFTSGSEILSGDEDEEEEFDRIQKIHASEGARWHNATIDNVTITDKFLLTLLYGLCWRRGR